MARVSEIDEGVCAIPAADFHYYLDGVEIRRRTLRLTILRMKKLTWQLLWFKHSENLNIQVAVVAATEEYYDLKWLRAHILRTGIRPEEAEKYVELFDSWLSRKISGFSWNLSQEGVTIVMN